MSHSPYPCLWFDGNAQDAAKFYVQVFQQAPGASTSSARIVSENPMVTMFELRGQHYMGLNGGPHFSFTEAFSIVIPCATQEEIDYFWNALTAGGKESQCGWLKDKFGLSWQVVPTILSELMSDPVRQPRVVNAFMKMKKFDINTLLNA